MSEQIPESVRLGSLVTSFIGAIHPIPSINSLFSPLGSKRCTSGQFHFLVKNENVFFLNRALSKHDAWTGKVYKFS